MELSLPGSTPLFRAVSEAWATTASGIDPIPPVVGSEVRQAPTRNCGSNWNRLNAGFNSCLFKNRFICSAIKTPPGAVWFQKKSTRKLNDCCVNSVHAGAVITRRDSSISGSRGASARFLLMRSGSALRPSVRVRRHSAETRVRKSKRQ